MSLRRGGDERVRRRPIAGIRPCRAQPPLQSSDIDVGHSTPASSASAAARPAASPIAMQGGISRESFCAAEVEE